MRVPPAAPEKHNVENDGPYAEFYREQRETIRIRDDKNTDIIGTRLLRNSIVYMRMPRRTSPTENQLKKPF